MFKKISSIALSMLILGIGLVPLTAQAKTQTVGSLQEIGNKYIDTRVGAIDKIVVEVNSLDSVSDKIQALNNNGSNFRDAKEDAKIVTLPDDERQAVVNKLKDERVSLKNAQTLLKGAKNLKTAQEAFLQLFVAYDSYGYVLPYAQTLSRIENTLYLNGVVGDWLFRLGDLKPVLNQPGLRWYTQLDELGLKLDREERKAEKARQQAAAVTAAQFKANPKIYEPINADVSASYGVVVNSYQSGKDVLKEVQDSRKSQRGTSTPSGGGSD